MASTRSAQDESDVVLTGLSGRLPESDSIQDFEEQLFAGVDLVTADQRRWTPGWNGLPKRRGKLKDLEHFDAEFFGVHAKQAHAMDPQLRLALEVTYEAIVDAGINPTELRGSCTGVYVGNLCSDTWELMSLDKERNDGYGLIGCKGRCAVFDASASGFVRSEAVVAVLLQRRCDARRVYCTVRGARVNTDGYKSEGILYPSGETQRRLAQETFEQARLCPQDVAYLETHSTGTKVGDPVEVNAIAELFCKDRQTPLLLGSVKSNMGHAEPAAGLCSVAKVVLAMERGVIPANLHFKKPNIEIPALSDGRIKVVDKNTPWQGGLMAINSFGFGGSNAHVILEGRRGVRPPPATYPAPRLVLASGRTDDAVERLLRLAAEHPRDAELHALIDAVHARAVPGHRRRGYAVLGPERGTPLMHELLQAEARPLWLLFSGFGSQWHGAARALQRLPAFAASIARSAAALVPHGFNLQYLLMEAPEAAFENIINAAVSITAVQVALVDVLRELDIRPDGIVGISLGEIGAAYADEALTVEQAVLCAYWRGRSIVDADLAPSAMASIGLSWEEVMRRCPPDIEPACDYSSTRKTVSGPPESIEKFIAELSAEGVFARHADSSGVGFHSKYIAAAAPLLHDHLLTVISEPKKRSARWLSTSVQQEQEDSAMANICDAAYFVNNLLSPVRFSGAMARLPARALVVELGPQAQLRSVVTREMVNAAYVPLLHRGVQDALAHMLAAVGKIYAAGAQPQVSRLYERVPWPVSRGTPSLASHVGWDHSVEWRVTDASAADVADHVAEIGLKRPEDAFIAGHDIDD